MSIEQSMSRVQTLMDLLRAVGELERGILRAHSPEELNVLDFHAVGVARVVVGRTSLCERVTAVRAVISGRLTRL